MNETLERLCVVCGGEFVPTASSYICPDCTRKAQESREA